LIANTAINNRQPDWFEQFVGALAEESGVNEAQMLALIARWGSLTDALKYVQLGSPENIVILPDLTAQEIESAKATALQ
jgi:hypothetical protein